MDDNSIMPFGKYKGQKLANVPADYLIWLKENNKRNVGNSEVMDYIQENIEILKQDAKSRRTYNT